MTTTSENPSLCLNRISRCGHVTKLLPCLHVVCPDCLNHEPRDLSFDSSSIECPTCRTSAGSWNNLSDNFFGSRLQELVRVTSSFSTMADSGYCQVCAPIPDGKAVKMCAPMRKQNCVVYCVDCNQFMCQSCFSCHSSMRLSRCHSVLSLIGAVDMIDILSKTQSKCQQHPMESEKLYCLECCSPTCLKCYTSGEHNSHEVTATFKVALEGRDRLTNDLKCIQERIERGKEFLDEVEREEGRFLENLEVVGEEIDKGRQILKSMFATFGSNLEQQLQQYSSQRLNLLSNVVKDSTKQLVDPSELVERLKDLLDIVPTAAIPELEADYHRMVENSKMCSKFVEKRMRAVSPPKVGQFQHQIDGGCLTITRDQLIDQIGKLVVNSENQGSYPHPASQEDTTERINTLNI